MKLSHIYQALACCLCLSLGVRADDYTVQPLNDPPPANVSKSIADQLAKTGIRVTSGGSTAYCDVWWCANWPTIDGFKPTAEVAYPFTPGQLIGGVRFARKGADFRDQDIRSGVYTLRYAQQPVDGAHVGTSLTRDFLLLVDAAKDHSPAVLDFDSLKKQSAEAAGSSHPALLSLQKIPPEVKQFPAMHHDAERDWWIVAVQGQARKGSVPLPLALVIVGHAAE